MRFDEKARLVRGMLFLFVLAAYLCCGWVYAQDTTGENLKKGAESAEKAESGEKEDAAGEKEKDDLVAVNLNKVKIDSVMKFLTEITGKAVVKHKDVQAELTVSSPVKVTKEQAFILICEALQLEKVAVIEAKDSIKLVPAEMLSKMLIELQPEDSGPLMGGVTRVIIPLRFADVKEIEELAKTLVSENGSVVAHPSSKKIVVTDTASRVRNIEKIVAMLDVLDTDQRQHQIFTLEHANAEEIAPIVKSVLGILAQKENKAAGAKPGQPPQPQQKGKPAPAPGAGLLDVVPYKDVNWLIVVAPKELLAAAGPLVTELDQDRPQELSLRILPIEYANADMVANQLMPLFDKRPDKRLKDTVEITAHERSSSLIVLSSEKNFELIKEIVTQLDTEDSVQMMTKTFELQYADASDIAEQMNELYQGMQQSSRRSYYWYSSSRGSEDKTRFVPETRTNSLIVIARPNEFDKIGEMIKKLDTPIDADQVAPRIFRLKYVDAKETTDVLNQVFGEEDNSKSGGYWDYWYGSGNDDDKGVGRLYGKVRFVPELTTNSIIVTTNNSENFAVIETFIKELDQFNPDAANMLVVVLQNANAEEVAEELNALFAREGARAPTSKDKEGEESSSYYASWLYGGSKKKEEREISNLIGQVRVVPDKRTNSLTITTAVQNFEMIRDLVEQLDEESPKVTVRVRLVEVTTTRSSRIGTRFAADESVLESDDFDNGIQSTFGLSWADVYHDGTISASSNLDISLLVQFLQRHADTRILSEPTLVMNNNELGTLFVGSRIPFITNSQTSAEGSLNQSFEYKDAGTTLKITPNINSLDKVEMKIELESSQIRPGEVLFGGFIIDSRQFETQLAVESGDTIVIGGIRRQGESDGVRRVPILGQIPVANLAFRKKDKKRETTELIAFITPMVLRGPENDKAATKSAAEHVELINDWRPLDPDKEKEAEEARKPWWKRKTRTRK